MSDHNAVSKFYNEGGWKLNSVGDTADAELYEDLRLIAANYVKKCRLRLLRYIPSHGDLMLDMASGPIQYPEYLEYSKNYNFRYCIDFSVDALSLAKMKLGEHGKYFVGDYLNMVFADNMFDCAISLHTIYHMPSNVQAKAVNNLIASCRPGSSIIIVYGNPFSLEQVLFYAPNRFVRKLFKGRFGFSKGSTKSTHSDVRSGDLYYHAFPLSWWQQFSTSCSVSIYPWRTFGTTIQKILFPNNFLGAYMFRLLFSLENTYPRIFSMISSSPVIVLNKK